MAFLAAAGCAPSEPGKPSDHLATEAAPIIGGQLDTTHPAVVAVLGNGYSCSGTIVQVKGNRGYVLTAAHCCPPGSPPTNVVIGTNYQSGQQYNVVQSTVTRDSCYENCPGSTDDVCMLQFSGATAATPAIPVMTSQTDQLQVGQNLTYVGFGLTSYPNGFNSTRRVVTKPIGTLDTYFVSYANASVSGTCEGDSGGPGLAMISSGEVVAAVTSYGDQNCTQDGTSIRAASVYAGFIGPYLADMPASPTCPKTVDCQVCSRLSTSPQCGGGCNNTAKACANDAACNALLTCYQGCSTFACQNTCNTQNIGGLQKYEAITSCVCAGSCSGVCANQFCSVASCGLSPASAPAGCTKCFQDNCCAEAWTCSQDGGCRNCFGSKPAAACAANAHAQAFYQCAASKCPSPTCTFPNPVNASGSSVTSTNAATTGAGGSGGGGGAASAQTAANTSATGAGGGGPQLTSGCGCYVAGDRASSNTAFGLLIASASAFAASRRRRSVRVKNASSS